MKVVVEGDPENVRNTLSGGFVMIEQRDADGNTPLIFSCTRGDESFSDIFQQIMDAGANIDAVNNNGETALIVASKLGHAKVCRLLIQKGARCDIRANDGNTALNFSIIGKFSDIYLALLDSCGDYVNSVVNNNGDTALILACRIGDKELCEKLIEKGALTDTQNIDGNSAFMNAIIKGHFDVCVMLIERGIDVNIVNKFGDTALILAARCGAATVVPRLISKQVEINAKNKKGETAIMNAIFNDHHGIASVIVDTEKVSVKSKNKEGNYTLHFAASKGWLDVCEALVKLGGDCNALNNIGESILMWAGRNGHCGVIRLLLKEGGADINLRSHANTTALLEAARGNHTDAIMMLIENGADVTIADSKGDTPLIVASRHGNSGVCRELMSKSSEDKDTRNNAGETALINAVYAGNIELCRLLIDAGVDLNIQDLAGDTAVIKACRAKNKELSVLLRDAGADPEIRNKVGHTPMHLDKHGVFPQLPR
jgi:ankyrin repeat protein